MKTTSIKLALLLLLICIVVSNTSSGQNVNSTVATTSYIPVWTAGPTFTLGNSQIFDNGTNIGIGTAVPTELFQVLGGNIDLNTATNSYMINRQPVLWHNGNISSIFLGVSAGNGTLNQVGNTLIGYQAGNLLTTGFVNTCVGAQAGRSMTTSNENVFVGYQAGYSQTDNLCFDNVFVGFRAGYFNTTVGGVGGAYNTFLGDEAGYINTNGSSNTFVGNHSGITNTTGNNNVFVGRLAGLTNTVGGSITLLGANSDCGSNNLTNASAIGANSTVRGSNQMILGNNQVNVGIGLSGNPTGPQDKLEIESASTGVSGLQFRSLTSSYSPTPFNTKFLTVDGNGKVVLENVNGAALIATENAAWVNGSGRIEWGTNRLLHDTEVPMVDGHTGDEWSIYFSGQSTMTNFSSQIGGFDPVDVGIGYTMTSPLRAKLDVWNLTATTANAQFTNQFAGRFSQTGSYTEPSGTTDFIGVYANSVVTHTGNMSNNIGGDFFATSSPGFNIGARGTAIGASRINAGLWGVAIPTGPVNIGVYGIANIVAVTPPAGSINYGVMGDLGVATSAPCPVWPCPGVPTPNAAGFFNGDVISTASYYSISDASFKENIVEISNPIEIINQLNPKSYTFNSQNQSMQLPSGIRYGLLSQEVESVLPGLVKDCIHPARYDSLGNEIYPAINFKAVNYTEIIPFLIAAIKEQQAQIDALTNAAPQQLQQNPNGDNNSGNSIDVVLASKTIVLNQNVPNPFKENTIIEYFIPDDASSVKIIFTDNKGSVLKEVEIAEKGKGQLNVYASDLSSGIYNYTIVANGITIDSKRMVKSK